MLSGMAACASLRSQQIQHQQGEHAVKSVNPELLVRPVESGTEGQIVRILCCSAITGRASWRRQKALKF